VGRDRNAIRACVLLSAYTVLLAARLSHAFAPAPPQASPPDFFGAVLTALCDGPCDETDHRHAHQHAHEEHCPLCQGIRGGVDEPAWFGAAPALAATALLSGLEDAPDRWRSAPITLRLTRGPPVR